MSLKNISTIIITCLLFSTLGLPVSPEVPQIDNPLPAATASVFQLAALIRLPFAITATMFSDGAPAAPGYDNSAPIKGGQDSAAGRNDRKENRDQGYFFSSQGKDAGFDLKTDTNGGSLVRTAKILARGAGTLPLNIVFLWLGFKYIFLLTCLLALLKSNLPWETPYTCV